MGLIRQDARIKVGVEGVKLMLAMQGFSHMIHLLPKIREIKYEF